MADQHQLFGKRLLRPPAILLLFFIVRCLPVQILSTGSTTAPYLTWSSSQPGTIRAISSFLPAALAQKPAPDNAWTLYNQRNYAAAADAFEKSIPSSKANARLYYYAALANRNSNRNARAKQLCQYLISNFSSSPEAESARRLFPELAPKAAGSSSPVNAVPDTIKGKTVRDVMKTEEGRKALATAITRKEEEVAKKQAEAARVSPMVARSKGGRLGQRVFAATDIAKDGAHGIDQMYYPNCWFESSMSALAMLPRGQSLLADMIRYGTGDGSYVVRFPNDGAEYIVDEGRLEKTGIHDKALWATLVECAQTLKFPNDNGGQLSDGLGCLTGHRAETITPGSASDQELASFIDGAVKSRNPIICGSQPYLPSGYPYLVIPSHAYTIVGFEPASGMVKIRNPHGANSERFSLDDDPTHQKFEQLDDGVFRIQLSLFKAYFAQVARSFI